MTALRPVLLSLVFATVFSNVGAKLQRPTHDEWKEGQADASNKKAAAAAGQAKMSAVDKVVSMLEGLQQQVLNEGEKEAQTYNKFACFCKDTTTEKTAAISKGDDMKAKIGSTIEALATERGELDTTIAGLLADIEAAETTMKQTAAQRAADLAVYEKNAADLAGALESLENAIKVMKASATPSLVQLQAVSKTLRMATLIADALGLSGASKVAALLQQEPGANPEVQMEDYKFHSTGIIETLEGLLKDFRAEKNSLDAEEVKSVAAHDATMQMETDVVKQKNIELDDSRKMKAKAQENIASNSERRSTVAATLLDDQQYLMELSQMCSDKAKTWDQRSKVRQDELSAITAATTIIKGAVSEKTSAATIRFAQQGVSVRLAEAVARSPEAMEAVEADAETADAAPVAFFQRSERKARAFLERQATFDMGDDDKPPVFDDGRTTVMALLRSKSQKLHSTLLASLVDRLSADPFAKIKVLIQELIERLLKEAANEGTQKGWCDKAIADAEQKRDYSAAQVEEHNANMAELEALRDTLTEELKVLDDEILDLNLKRNEAEKLREEEKAENKFTVEEAEAGLAAVQQAMDILVKFYKTKAKETVALSQHERGPADDAPDAGFKNMEAYKGASSEAGGIVGMLEVIESDFTRTITETQKAEAQAEQDHLVFMTESGKSLAEKTVAHEEKTTQNGEAKEKLSEADSNLQTQSGIMNGAIKELIELQPACIDTGMSYEDRVARREDEIAALNKADCILNAYAQYGPEGLGDACP